MSIITTAYNWLTGWATRQGTGTQYTQPSATAFDDVPTVGPDAALQVSAVWACVKLLSETISSLPLHVYVPNEQGQRQVARDESIYRILHDRPNSRQTAMEFWEYMMFHRYLRGNAYAHIRRNGLGQVTALWPLSADHVEVKLLDSGKVVYFYTRDGNTLAILDRDMLHIRGMGTDIVGLAPLDYMRGSVSLSIRAQGHMQKTYAKNARRPGLLMSQQVLTKEQREALKNNFSEIASGGEKELYILEAGFQFEALGMTPADLQLLETRRYSIEDLARWFGVPSVLINDTQKATTWGSGVQQIVEGFYKFTIRPEVERIEQSIQERVMSAGQRASGMIAEFSLDALLRANMKDRMEIYSRSVQNGIFTRNECRHLENMPPMEGGDELTAQTNLRPVDMLRDLDGSGESETPAEPILQRVK